MAVLTVCIPTCDRPGMVRRAVSSVLRSADRAIAPHVELVVTDNSSGAETSQVVQPLLERWPGPTRYSRNIRDIGMVANFNRCLALATGQWIHILHDDDYLLAGGLERILRGLERAGPGDRAMLFGVRVTAGDGRLLRLQVPLRRRSLAPQEAVRRHLTYSSYVRFPAIVVHGDAYEAVGQFDASVAAATDFDMWSRVFAAFGVRHEPAIAVAYVVHLGTATERMFTEEYVGTLMRLFDRVVALGVLPEGEVRRRQAHWFHQFALAGAVRRARARDWQGVAEMLELLELEPVRRLGPSLRWQPLQRVLAYAARRSATATEPG